MRQHVVIAVVCTAALVMLGCGGGSSKSNGPATGKELARFQIKAAEASQSVATYCYRKAQVGVGSVPSLDRAADMFVDAYQKSRRAPAIKQEMRQAANLLRGCGENAVADRLNNVTDAP